MYRPAAFDVDEPGSLLTELLAAYAATLVTSGDDGLESTILPLLYDPAAGPLGTLTGHVARGNPLVRDGHAGEALVVVTGVEGYISPSWYPSKAEDGKVVPTWDYVTVQAAGPLVLHDDADWLLDNVSGLADRHERDRPAPWAVSDAPARYVTAMLRGIVGVEIPVARLAGKAKLSQNRPAADVAGVIAGLRADGPSGADLAEAVARARPRTGE
jgi:transcriptional regulator